MNIKNLEAFAHELLSYGTKCENREIGVQSMTASQEVLQLIHLMKKHHITNLTLNGSSKIGLSTKSLDAVLKELRTLVSEHLYSAQDRETEQAIQQQVDEYITVNKALFDFDGEITVTVENGKINFEYSG